MYFDVMNNKMNLSGRLEIENYDIFNNEYSIMPKQIDCLTDYKKIERFSCALVCLNGVVLEIEFAYIMNSTEINLIIEKQIFSNYPLDHYTPINVKLSEDAIFVQAVNKHVTDALGNNDQKLISYVRRN